jgi:hypothetical protein
MSLPSRPFHLRLIWTLFKQHGIAAAINAFMPVNGGGLFQKDEPTLEVDHYCGHRGDGRPDLTEFGYRKFPNVITSLEFERLINAGGPSGGSLIRPSDRRIPKTVAFLQCIGSRSKRSNIYCSNICCMNTIKDALLIKEQPGTKSRFLYRYSGPWKGAEDLTSGAGRVFIRVPGEIEDPTKI